ncbi:thioredoxin family protein [Gemmatimonas aurantiaca]|nr:thioredoxin family protein [Gemmatimonas aurantiaca]
MLTGGASAKNASEWKTNDEARARIVMPFGLEPDGRTIWLGLDIDLEPEWHAYWKNPGDAGLPPEFTVLDSELVADLEVLYTPPKFYPFGGGLDANGYADRVMYPLKLTLSEEAASAGIVEVELSLFYLVCKDLCIPHDETFLLTLDLSKTPYSANPEKNVAKRLATAIEKLPRSPEDIAGLQLHSSLRKSGEDYRFQLRAILPETVNEFPEIFLHSTPSLTVKPAQYAVGDSPNEVIVTIPLQTKVAGAKLDTITIGYLLTGLTENSDTISVETSALMTVSADDSPMGAKTGLTGDETDVSLLSILLFALIGGLILNVMPCVLPVLSIKLIGVMQHSGESHSKVARAMLFSTGGIVFSFLLLATAAVIAKSAGAAVGWGIQFQEPLFVTFLTLIVFIFGLNLWGLFEVTLPSSVSSGAAKSASTGGHFLQGMFATLLATPCTAPFLGTAVTFALVSPSWVIFSVFGVIGIGMSLPYLVIAVFPKAIRFLPKPGVWMEKAKILFGFMLIATAILGLYILSLQIEPITLLKVLLGLWAIGLIVWLKQAFAPLAGFFSSVGGLLTVISVGAIGGYTVYLSDLPPAQISAEAIQWQEFSDAVVEKQLAAGAVVFVDVTAEWCLTCKFNEKLFIETDEMRARIKDNGIVSLKADWTNRNTEIGEFLARYGRSGIPFYIIFYGGSMDNFITLPVTITEGMLAEKLDEALSKNKN